LAVSVGLAIGTPADGSPDTRFRIAVLTTAMSPWHTETEGFRDGLKQLGYLEGRNLTLIARAAQGDPMRVRSLAQDLVQLQPDLLLCVSSSPPRPAKRQRKPSPLLP
jgi:putative tryptophan/tyrosine transport system substrate-binding protein